MYHQPLFHFFPLLAVMLSLLCGIENGLATPTVDGELNKPMLPINAPALRKNKPAPTTTVPVPAQKKLITPRLTPKPTLVSQPNTEQLPAKKAAITSLNAKKYYQVNAGETLYTIGINTGYGYDKLAQWNQLAPPYALQAGQQLKLFNPALTSVTGDKKPIKIPQPATLPPKASVSATVPPKRIVIPEQKTNTSHTEKKITTLSFQWPLLGRVSKSFAQSNNQGIDIESTTGKQPVLAAAAGQVVYTGQGLIGLKNLIIIQHNEHYLTAYANNTRLLAVENQQVKSGQVIAEISTNYPFNVLHFQIRKNGIPINPLILLPK